MKIDRLQLKLIIGLIFIAIIYVVVLIIEPKDDNKVIANNSISNDMSQENYYANNTANINNSE